MDFVALGWIICAIASGIIAAKRGRSPFLGYLLGIGLGLLALVLVLLVIKQKIWTLKMRSFLLFWLPVSLGTNELISIKFPGGTIEMVRIEAGTLDLDRHPRTEVMVVNPIAIKNYAGARLQRAKTDPSRFLADP